MPAVSRAIWPDGVSWSEELGRLTLPQIFAPAIEYAEEGIATSPFFQAMTESGVNRGMQPEWRELYFEGSRGGAVNALFKQPALARTLTAIARGRTGLSL